MRNMSFSMTTEAFRRREKTVTRRDGWWDLDPGDILMGVVKGMGLRKGEQVEKMHRLRVVLAQPEPLAALFYPGNAAYARAEMVRECLCDDPAEFVRRYIDHNGGDLDTLRNRIEFEHECPNLHGLDSGCPLCHGTGWVSPDHGECPEEEGR